MLKHATATAFVMHQDAAHDWRTGMVLHPIFQQWMPPGGHVEADENPEETVRREITEETGLASVRLVNTAADDALPEQPTAQPIQMPLWIVEHPMEHDNHLAEPHIHVDHKYLAITDDPHSAAIPDHPFAWYTQPELADVPMLEDVRTALEIVFAMASRLTAEPVT